MSQFLLSLLTILISLQAFAGSNILKDDYFHCELYHGETQQTTELKLQVSDEIDDIYKQNVLKAVLRNSVTSTVAFAGKPFETDFVVQDCNKEFCDIGYTQFIDDAVTIETISIERDSSDYLDFDVSLGGEYHSVLSCIDGAKYVLDRELDRLEEQGKELVENINETAADVESDVRNAAKDLESKVRNNAKNFESDTRNAAKKLGKKLGLLR